MAIGAEGVHIGQDDMGRSLQTGLQSYALTFSDIKTARRLMGPNAIVGVTCSTSEEACIAAASGASYLGIGTMFATPT